MSFERYNFDSSIEEGIRKCGYESPTPIQEKAIPEIQNGRDVIGLAQTGTGKTAAFALPLLQKLMTGPRRRLRALIVVPTRELADQIHETIHRLGQRTGLRSATIYGGVSKQGQLQALRSGVEIIVACPGRLLDHLNCGDLRLKHVELLVLDEADMMFDMGFLPAIRRILKALPVARQNLLFSATMPGAIRKLAGEILTDPATIQLNHSRPADTVDHVLFQVSSQGKTQLLEALMRETIMESALIFTRTKHGARKLAESLQKAGFQAVALQGNMSQNQRRQAMDGFRRGRYRVLVATDIASRGIDIAGISHVINYDIPDTIEAYTHRIGRTGRARCTGEAITFAGKADSRFIKHIEEILKRKMVRRELQMTAARQEKIKAERNEIREIVSPVTFPRESRRIRRRKPSFNRTRSRID